MKNAFKLKNETPARNFRVPFSLLLRHEWRQMSREKTLWLMTFLLSGLMIYAAFNGSAWIDFQDRMMRKTSAEETERLNAMRTELEQIERGEAKPKMFRDPSRPGWVGEFLGARYANFPNNSLAPLSIGQRDLYPYYFRVSTLSADNFINDDEIENPFNLLTGRFDTAFVIVYLLPLFILAISYNLLSGEKENGTLQLLLSQPLSVKTLLIGQVSARAIYVICLIGLLGVVGAVVVGGADLSNGETILRLALWIFAVVLYALFWFAMAAFVNSFGKSSPTNAVTLFTIWIALTVIVPAFLTLLTTNIYPVESRLKLITEIREEKRKISDRANEILEEFYLKNTDLRPFEPDKKDYMPGFYAAQIERDKKLLPKLKSYETQLARQNALDENLRVISPPLSMQSALNDLAATSFYRYQNFLDQVHIFHAEWQQFFLPKLFKRESLRADDYDRFPKFELADEPFGAVLQRIFFGLCSILIPTFLIGILTVRQLKKFSVAG
jgi:ABC-2 type transport system permease protein